MKISARNLSFSYTGNPLFDNLSLDFNSTEGPLVILGPSGSGKTTLLKLLGGLLKPQAGEIIFFGENSKNKNEATDRLPQTAFIFQEPRLLPWLTVLENVSIPVKKIFGNEEAKKRARHFLSLVSLEEKRNVYPKELSGGQAQRVSIARAFAWPAQALFMDEPFQSLDIPLRVNLMDLTLSLLSEENFPGKNLSKINRLLIAVTHDPREALYIGGRIIVLGNAGEGIVFDKAVDPESTDRSYGSAAGIELEREIIRHL